MVNLPKSRISEESIQQFVNNLLKKDNGLKSFLPYIIENKVYITVIAMILNIVLHLLQDFEICIFDHIIKCTIKPATFYEEVEKSIEDNKEEDTSS